jgi:hypothetical protein
MYYIRFIFSIYRKLLYFNFYILNEIYLNKLENKKNQENQENQENEL